MRVCSNFLISSRCKNYASKSNEIKNRIKSKHPAMKFLKIYLSRSIIKTLYIYFAVRNISIIIFSFVRVFVYSFLANSNFRYTSKIEIDEQFT